MGLGAMALEVLTLILCQIHLGLLYRQMGLLIAAFMAGMGLGSAWGVRLAAQGRATAGRLSAFQGGLALLALLLLYLPPMKELFLGLNRLVLLLQEATQSGASQSQVEGAPA